MIKIVPDANYYLPALSPLEQETLKNFRNYFTTVQKDSDITLYIHPDTINANISMVLDNRIEYRQSVFHQLWLVNVVDSNDGEYDQAIWDSAQKTSSFKTSLLWNKAFSLVEYPDWLNDEYKLSYHSAGSHKTSLKQRFAINTLLIADRRQLTQQIAHLKKNSAELQDNIATYLTTRQVADLSPQGQSNYIKFAHTVWVDEMTTANKLFSKVMSPRTNAWTALTPGEYDIVRYLIGFNLTNENIEVHTDKVLKDPKLVALVEDAANRVAVRGLAKTGKTTLLIMRALRAAQRGERVTITSYTYANLARIRLMLQALSENAGTLRLQGITLKTVSSIRYSKDALETDAFYIDNAEDISEDELRRLISNNASQDIFIAYNPDQQVLFNRTVDDPGSPADKVFPDKAPQKVSEKNWPLNEGLITEDFHVVSTNTMVNGGASPIKMIYQDFLNDYTNENIAVHDSQGKPAVFIRDAVDVESPILTADELQIIKGAIDKQYRATNISTNGRFATAESQNIAIVCPQFSPLVQVSMFLDREERDKKQGRSFLTYKEIIDQSNNQELRAAIKDETSFTNLVSRILNQSADGKGRSPVNSFSAADIERVRTFIIHSKSDFSKSSEVDLHRLLPAMMNRLILSTLESFKGLQAEVLVAILPADDKFKLGNYTTILSSAKSKLIIINRNEKFHEFIERERAKCRHFLNHDHSIICF